MKTLKKIPDVTHTYRTREGEVDVTLASLVLWEV